SVPAFGGGSGTQSIPETQSLPQTPFDPTHPGLCYEQAPAPQCDSAAPIDLPEGVYDIFDLLSKQFPTPP
ncbi:hypothetical protein LINGRAHAP2_LOCUS24343, partial [Linum grandiflorum]